MWSSSAISALVRPWATVSATSSSRSVSVTSGWARFEQDAESAKPASRRAVMLGRDEGVALVIARVAWRWPAPTAALSRTA